ncbi:carbohydrate kinase family protein [Streptomyces varsoviensis]|uniref:carbohydrate kinase family protein n=1 Tax=Streptomyces varsoviensis TaxID=67373 RepID=UPI0033FE8AD4
MPTAYDLLVIGDANPDVILGPLTGPLAFGRREQLTDSGALCHDGRSPMSAPNIPVTPTDTVGAGDSFDAGFIAATIRRQPPHQAPRIAAVCGALSTRVQGGTAAQATWDEALTHLSPNGAHTS